MTVIGQGFPFPYDIARLLGGAARVLYAPLSVAIPTRIEDVIFIEKTGTGGPYQPATGWVDFGATKDQFAYDRGFTTDQWQIQQTTADVEEEVTDITRTLTVSVAEFRPDTLQMLENADAVGAVAAAAHKSAQDRVAFGLFSALTRYRFAFISRRSLSAGVVIESDTATKRGRFFMGVANQASIAAENVTMDQAKGALTATGVKFKCYPDPAAATDEEHGAWYDEHAGTIAGP